MACHVDNNAYEVITPSRKRKRELDSSLPSEGLTNAGFSSTPKSEAKLLIDSYNRLAGKRIENTNNPFRNNLCLEVKSIAEIAENLRETENPFEVIRIPPKKKKKEDEACFVNPALNLEVPDKQFNPFEVKRDTLAVKDNNCFSNPGLNIRVEDNNAALNPFEITRLKEIQTPKNGIENPALEIPTPLTITLPFQPTVGCRIDFNQVPLSNLTPSKMLAEKLVFTTPVDTKATKTPSKSFRRSLSIISEESVDIGKELDCYQLELENSINEAKLRKNNIKSCKKNSPNFEQRLAEIEESVSEDSSGVSSLSNEEKDDFIQPEKEECIEEQEVDNNDDPVHNDSKDELFEGDITDDEIDFKAPAPFVRAYRKPDNCLKQEKTVKIQENIEYIKEKNENKNKFANVIRRSIRKLTGSSKSNTKEIHEDKSETGNHLFEALRHSIRRKSKTINKLVENNIENSDISIVENYERQVFKSATNYCGETENIIINRKATLRSSFRKSTRTVRNKIIKSVFKKSTEEYKFNQ